MGGAPVDLPFAVALGEASIIDPEHVLRPYPLSVVQVPGGSVVWKTRHSGFSTTAAAGDYVVYSAYDEVALERWR